MPYAAALLGLALVGPAQGLVEQPWSTAARARWNGLKKSRRGPEAYDTWANAFAQGTRRAPSKVPSQKSNAATAEEMRSQLVGLQKGQIRSCFDDDCDHWMDEQGERIEAHGAGMLQDPKSGRWYWYGESMKEENLIFHGINCYSADNLAGPWRLEGQVMQGAPRENASIPTTANATQMIGEQFRGARENASSPAALQSKQVFRQGMIKVPNKTGPYVIERPKVLYNKKTNKFVMWFHLDDAAYQFRHVGVATADSPTGPFTFVHAIQPDGIPSLDMSLWVDVDDKAYFIRSCNNNYTGISGLTPDYLNTNGLLSKGPRLEGMALFRIPNGTLYMMTSHLTGWKPNPLMLYRAKGPNLADPQWENLGNPTHERSSYNTQPTYVVPFTTKKNLSYFIYMADNWIHSGSRGLLDASYVWLPIRFEGDEVFVDKRHSWDLQDPFNEVIHRPVFG